MNIPNFLTILRLFFPIFIGIVCYLKLDINLEKLIILVLFILFSLTDYLDGFLARKLNQESVFGKIFDPISDKILTSTSLIYILTFENIILIPSLLIITRCPLNIVLVRHFRRLRILQSKHRGQDSDPVLLCISHLRSSHMTCSLR